MARRGGGGGGEHEVHPVYHPWQAHAVLHRDRRRRGQGPAMGETQALGRFGRRAGRDTRPRRALGGRCLPRDDLHHAEGGERPKHADRCKSLARKARALWPTGIPDLGKLARVVEDALEGMFYRNDSQVVQQLFSKQYGPSWRTEIVVYFMEEADAQPA